MASQRNASSQPAVNGTQLNSGSLGNVNDSVNLYRGDVNFPLQLLALTGRNGLDVNIKAFYQSNVQQFVQQWNKEASTGTLGVGWSLPFERIINSNTATDSEYDDSFYLYSGGAMIPLFKTGAADGVIEFQMKTEQFWKLHYYTNANPELERWEVVKEDGSVFIYGPGGGIQWGVRWKNWTGPTTEPSGTPYPVAWNLTEVRNRWGDAIHFEYEYDMVPIGSDDSASYTRNTRLKHIRDVFGRTVDFHYNPKESFEIQFPEVPPLLGTPNAFQFFYDTKYLASMDVREEDGALLFTTLFHYDFYNVASYPNNTHDHFKKRYLVSVVQRNEDGNSLPGLDFSYYDQPSDVHPGALKQVLYPEGGVATYTYESNQLMNSSTRKVIYPPTSGAIPRVWQGSDYTVVTWYDATAGSLTLSVYTWGGAWTEWQQTQMRRLDIDTLLISPSMSFFVLSFKDTGTGAYKIYAYRNDRDASGVWDATPFQPNPGYEIKDLSLATGANFFALGDENRGDIDIYSWDIRTRSWDNQHFGLSKGSHFNLAAGDGYLLATVYLEATKTLAVRLLYTDQNDRWQIGDDWTAELTIDWQYTNKYTLLSHGTSWLTITYIRKVTETTIDYEIRLLQWDAFYRFAAAKSFPYQQATDIKNPIAFTVAVQDQLGNAQHIFRFDGKDWVQPDTGWNPTAGPSYRFAYGSDLTVQLVKTGDDQVYNVYQFNPYSRRWESTGRNLPGSKAGDDIFYMPTISGSYRTIGQTIAYRNEKQVWDDIGQLPSDADLETVQNRAPSFLAFQKKDGTSSQLLFVRNGKPLGSPVSIDGESLYVRNPKAGQGLVGSSSFVTFKGTDFEKSPNLFLYKVVNQSIEHYQHALSVAHLTIDDGYAQQSTFYKYDNGSATVDPSGTVAQYAKVRTYTASATGENGYVEHLFFNGLNPEAFVYPHPDAYNNVRTHFSLFNGQLYQKRIYNAAGICVAYTSNSLYAFTGKNTGTTMVGYYVRALKVSDVAALYAFPIPVSYADDLDKSVFPSSLRTLFIEKGFDPGTAPEVSPGAADGIWLIYDANTGQRYTITRDGNLLKVYCEVENVTTQKYNQKGQLRRTETLTYDSTGKPQQNSAENTYGWEIPAYSEMLAQNLLVPCTQIINRTNDTITEISVNTLTKDWEDDGKPIKNWVANKTFLWNGDKAQVEFRFDLWSGPNDPAQGWLKTKEVLAINAKGLVIETADIDGIRSSNIYDIHLRQLVATVSNASVTGDEASYYGFEVYENKGIWSIAPSGQSPDDRIVTGDSFTGTRSLLLRGTEDPNVGLSGVLRPRNGQQPYFAECRFKTTGEVSPSDQCGWNVTVSGSGTTKSVFFPISGMGWHWSYMHMVIDPSELGMERIDSIRFFLSNQLVGTDLLVDNIMVCPMLADLSANIYDEQTALTSAFIQKGDVYSRFYYDQFLNAIASSGESEKPKSLTVNHLWRQDGDRFSPSFPNESVSMAVRTGGYCLDFHKGDEWVDVWSSTGDWTITNFTLCHKEESPATLTLRDAASYSNFGLRFLLDPKSTTTEEFGIRVGTCLSVTKKGNKWRLAGKDGESIAEAAASDSLQDVLLVVTQHGLLFYTDGNRLFSHIFEEEIIGAPEIFTGGPLGITFLTVFTDPVLSATYSDNTGKIRQQQALNDIQMLCQATLYDAVGRAAVQTKTGQYDTTLFGYRSDFVTSMDWHSGVMTGVLPDRYPDDQGYPYTRQRYSASPIGQVIEVGNAGKDFAIDLRVPEAERHTVFTSTSTNTDELVVGLPAGKYVVEHTLNPDKIPSLRLTDLLGNVLYTKQGDAATRDGLTQMSRNEYDVYGNLSLVMLPNFFSNEVPDSDSFTERYQYDFFGRVTEKQTPDESAPLRYIYDNAGRVRFMQDAAGALSPSPYILYCAYDSLGRLIEKGSCNVGWNAEELQAGVNNPVWLPSEGIWTTRYTYDGDGQDVRLLGQLWKTAARNSENDQEIGEVFEYNDLRLVSTKRTEVPEFGGVSPVSGFSYNNLGGPVEIVYDVESEDSYRVSYDYNNLSVLQRIRGGLSGKEQEVLADYAYNPDGSLRLETFRAASGQLLNRDYRYNSTGWVTEIGDAHFREKLEYTRNGYGGTGYYSGQIARTSSIFGEIANPGGFTTAHDYAYAYDTLGRLTVAQNSVNPLWNLGVTANLDYDPNGNLQRYTPGDATKIRSYYPGTNRLETLAEATKADLGYAPGGNVTSVASRGIRDISYTRGTLMTTSIEREQANPLRFGYDADLTRVLKISGDTKKLYVSGVTGKPIMEITVDGSGMTKKTYLIYGVSGLIASLDANSDAVLFLLKDHLGSTRATWSGGAVSEAFNYLPFGGFMGETYSSDGRADFLQYYLYTGQELDAETGLYNYRARLYDPVACIFYSIDPAGQFASPYLYTGNNPICFNDPTGLFSWAAFGAIVGGVLAIVGGVVLTVVTAGAATPVLVAAAIGGGALIGAGMASAVYGATHTADGSFKAGEWGVMVGLGAAFGAISGGASLATGGLSIGAAIAAETFIGAGLGAVDGFVTNGIINTMNDKNFMDGAGEAAGWGALFGGVAGGIGGAARLGNARPRGSHMTDAALTGKVNTLTRRAGADGYVRMRDMMELVPSGTPNTFVPGRGLQKGFKYEFTDAAGGNWTVRAHAPSARAPQNSNAYKGWTAKIEGPQTAAGNGKRMLTQDGQFLGGGQRVPRINTRALDNLNEAHLPFAFRFWP